MSPRTSSAGHWRRRQSGFTLIEAMVALLVLSIGLLGIAALYVETLRASRTSLNRSVAVTLATGLADRMRANRNPADAYDCSGDCTAGEGGNAIAIADITDWVGTIAQQLPEGTGSVTYVAPANAVSPDAYIVQVSWTEVGQDDPVTYQIRVEI